MRLNTTYGVRMNHKKIRRIMRTYNLHCMVRRKNPYKQMMQKTQEHTTSDNILSRNFSVTKPGRVYCTDITYLYYHTGRKAYLSVIKDIASGEVVAWKVSMNLELTFVLESLEQLRTQQVAPQALIHSDQGFHYTSPAYRHRVKLLGLVQSMSRKGNCIDNAPIESFFGHFKDELEYRHCTTFEELQAMVNTYMYHYNNNRPQWGLQKMTPVNYRNHLLQTA